MKARLPIFSLLRWVLPAGFAAAAVAAGGACGDDACENAYTHMQACLMERVDAGGIETATSNVDCSGSTQCEAICVLNASCDEVKIHANAIDTPTSHDPLGDCLAKCAHGTTR
jgi:hypothetical protein